MDKEMRVTQIAEIFPPGDFIKEELEARGWSQLDLAEIIDRDPVMVNQIIKGKRAITPETARAFGEAFGTSALLWLNLETAYQLAKAEPRRNDISKRAQLYDFPVREMVKRHWIDGSDDVNVLEHQLLKFLGIATLEDKPKIAHAARKSTSKSKAYGEVTTAQWAWLRRAYQLAPAVHAKRFSDRALNDALESLRRLLPNAEDVRYVPRILSNAGIRFLVVEPLPNTKIDGVCFWLNDNAPVIALTLRFDRIDWFWHTLIHEIDHVQNREGKDVPLIDTELVGEGVTFLDEKPEAEKRADDFASSFLIQRDELKKFIARVKPLYSKLRIELFAKRIQVHRGIVVGQLQFRKQIPYKHSREMVEKIRAILTPSALTDGYGETPML